MFKQTYSVTGEIYLQFSFVKDQQVYSEKI